MEQSKPTFLSREAIDDIRFYQDWIRDALLSPSEPKRHQYFRNMLDNLSASIEYLELEDDFLRLKEAWDAKVRLRVDETVADLTQHIFEDGLFMVAIRVGEETHIVESLVVDDDLKILPVVGGATCHVKIDEVLFDR